MSITPFSSNAKAQPCGDGRALQADASDTLFEVGETSMVISNLCRVVLAWIQVADGMAGVSFGWDYPIGRRLIEPYVGRCKC